MSKLSTELADIATLQATHGTDALLAALRRAVEFGRWQAADVRSILSAGGAAPTPRPAGQALLLTLPSVPTRSLEAYRIGGEQLELAPPALAADLTSGLKRLKMAGMRRLAPECSSPPVSSGGTPRTSSHPGRGRDRRPR